MDVRLFGRPVNQQHPVRYFDIKEVSLALVSWLRRQNHVQAVVVTNQNLRTVRFEGVGISTSILADDWKKIQNLIISGAFNTQRFSVVSATARSSVLEDPESDPLYKQVKHQLTLLFGE